MAQSAQVDVLAAKHRDLELMIKEEQSRPSGNDLKIAELKRQKLKLKDEMLRLESKTSH